MGGKREKGLADVISLHDIHKRIDQSDFTARKPGSADSAFSSDGGVYMLIAFASFLADIVKAKSKTMDFWVRRRPLLSTFRKISGCLSSL